MKRFLTMIVAACAFFAVSAQYPMATLSHNGELSFFNDLNAFNSAVDSAQDGDIIYLSEGEFVVAGGSITFSKKAISIVGCGYGTHILGNIRYSNPYGNEFDITIERPIFDGVRIDCLDFERSFLSDAEIKRCWIKVLKNGGNAAKNVSYDKCYIEQAEFGGNGSVFVTNSKLSGTVDFPGGYSDSFHKITAKNCNISKACYYPNTLISCIFTKGTNEPNISGYCSLINSLIDFTPSSSSNLYTHDCYTYTDENTSLLDDKLNCSFALDELGYLGQDGTVVGIMGGESPFSENPSVPTVDSAKSSVEYDAENKKLKVVITVAED